MRPMDLAGTMSEQALDGYVRGIVRDLGLLAYHTYDSRRSEPGFPDWVIAGAGGVLYRELKTEHGKLTKAQETWGRVLTDVGVDYKVWRPSDLIRGEVAKELATLRKRRK